MELHKFYLNDKSNPHRLTPTLYAFTNDDNLAKVFRNMRNPDLFTYLHDTVTEDMYKDVKHKFSEKQLKKTRLITRSDYDPTETTDIPIVCTWEEEKRVVLFKEDLLYSLRIHRYMTDTYILPVEMNKILYDFGYFYFYKWLYMMSYIEKPLSPYFDGVTEPIMESQAYFSKIKYDEFSVFMLIYGNTMREQRGKDTE